MKIAWISRHEVLPAQRRALEERFGRVEIVKIVDTFTSADNVLRQLDAAGAGAAVVVLPLSMISILTERRPDFSLDMVRDEVPAPLRRPVLVPGVEPGHGQLDVVAERGEQAPALREVPQDPQR